MLEVVTLLMRKIRETGDKNRIEINNAKLKKDHRTAYDTWMKNGQPLQIHKVTNHLILVATKSISDATANAERE